MSIYGRITRPGPSGFGYRSTAREVTDALDLADRTFLVTGCSSGLGRETARALMARGATVVAAARTREKSEAVARELGGSAIPLGCDLSDPASVRAAVTALCAGPRLHGVIANAGIMALPERHVAHGVELQLFTNHVGHFILVTGVLDHLTEDARVVVVSSNAHRRTYPEGIRFEDLSAEKRYAPWLAYGQSKLANLLFARELATRLPRPEQTANAIHPGVIMTNLTRHLNPVLWSVIRALAPIVFTKSVEEGAATQTYVAAHPGAARINGEYWAHCNVAESSPHGRDRAMAKRLWSTTEEIVARL